MEGECAAIERGVVVSVLAEGYKVKSCSRSGLTTPVIPSVSQAEYAVGDPVYFFMFNDGKGAVLAPIR